MTTPMPSTMAIIMAKGLGIGNFMNMLTRSSRMASPQANILRIGALALPSLNVAA